MSRFASRRLALTGAGLFGAAMLACLVLLARGYWKTQSQVSAHAERIAELQVQVEADAAHAPILAETQAQQSAALREWKARVETLSLVLIASAVAFFACAKWRVALAGRPAPPPHALVQVNLPSPAPVPERLNGEPPTGPLVTVSLPPPAAIDLTHVDELVARFGRDREAAIPLLQAVQGHYRYLPEEALARICALTDITPAQIAGTSSFYSQFRRSPVGEHIVRVCHGTACHVAGARRITDELRRHLGIAPDADTDPQRRFTLEEVACLGCCSLAPVLMVDEHTAGNLTPLTACAALPTVVREVPA
jgi:NADH:ubiquinone oxidoreductase subunit E